MDMKSLQLKLGLFDQVKVVRKAQELLRLCRVHFDSSSLGVVSPPLCPWVLFSINVLSWLVPELCTVAAKLLLRVESASLEDFSPGIVGHLRECSTDLIAMKRLSISALSVASLFRYTYLHGRCQCFTQ